MMKRLQKTVMVLLLLCLAVWLIGVLMIWRDTPSGNVLPGEIVAYRGSGDQVDYQRLALSGCTANSLRSVDSFGVENTRMAVDAALAAGVDTLHLNVRRTKDNALVVFHDQSVDCATNGQGEVGGLTLEELMRLDAGYGYTADEGQTYPYLGKGLRLEALEHYLERYPQQRFWLNLKAQDLAAFALLKQQLLGYSDYAERFVVLTSEEGKTWFDQQALPLKVISVDSVKQCGLQYLLVGWTGWVPQVCRDSVLLLPPGKADLFWGYPDALAERFRQHNTPVLLWYKHHIVAERHREVLASGIGIVSGDREALSHMHQMRVSAQVNVQKSP